MANTVSVSPELDTPVNPYSLLEAVNDASDTVNTGWLIFLAIMAYVVIAVAGVTHRDLLLETPVALPLLQVNIQLGQFFKFAPILLVLFHLGIVAQLVLLARKTLEFDAAVRLLEATEKRTHPLRLELHSFFFVQAIAGPDRARVISVFLHGMSWLTTVMIPVVLLLYIQVSYLPAHDVSTTWLHRIALLIDLGVLLLIGTFLMRTESSFFEAFKRNAAAHPVNVAITSFVLINIFFLSFLVATVPGERLDVFAQSLFTKSEATGAARTRASGGFNMPFLTTTEDGTLLGLFRRNIVLTDTDLVADKDATAGEPTLNLRGRDLRFAKLDRSDLHQADFTGADLSDASFAGADLRDARLGCSDLDRLILTDDRGAARCAAGIAANFSRARLDGAILKGGNFAAARFADATLDRADLGYTILTGADFSSAKLNAAEINGGARAEGANFLLASFQGADLAGLQAEAADFASASLEGANLAFANLAGATLRDAEMEGAVLSQTKLFGADLQGATIAAADLRGASVWRTIPPKPDDQSLADLTGVTIAPPSPSDVESMSQTMLRVEGMKGGGRVREVLPRLLPGIDDGSWALGDDARAWEKLKAALGGRAPDTLRLPLGEHLAALACKRRWANGAVATGIIRRAQSAQFAGNPAAIQARLRGTDCPATANLPPALLRDFSVAVDPGPN